MRFTFLLPAVGALACGLCLAAHADSYVQVTLGGDPNQASASFVVDTTTNTVVSGTANVYDVQTDQSFQLTASTTGPNRGNYLTTFTDSSGDHLYLTEPSLTDGVNICSTAHPCQDFVAHPVWSFLSPSGESYLYLANGQLSVASYTPGGNPSPTPEPSSLALLGTGLLGGAGMLRRRIARA